MSPSNVPSLALFIFILTFAGCSGAENTEADIADKVNQYTTFTLEADLSGLSGNQKKMIPLLIEAAEQMDKVFWLQAYGDKEELLSGLDHQTRKYVQINYGPWDRLNNNEPFIRGVGENPAGANFYPADMTKEEFEEWDSAEKNSLYTLVRRDDDGQLITIPYSEAFREEHQIAADKLREAAA